MVIKEFKEYNSLLELAQITSNNDFFRQNYGKILIKGGGDNISGQKEHNPPHFHLELNNGNEIVIIIPFKIDGEIVSLEGNLNSKIIKDLKKWFMLPYRADKSHNNYEMLKIQWDTLNYGDDNVDKFSI